MVHPPTRWNTYRSRSAGRLKANMETAVVEQTDQRVAAASQAMEAK
jgi:hypothetical protein